VGQRQQAVPNETRLPVLGGLMAEREDGFARRCERERLRLDISYVLVDNGTSDDMIEFIGSQRFAICGSQFGHDSLLW